MDVGVVFQQVQGVDDVLFVIRHLEHAAVDQQDGDVPRRGFERLDEFDEEQCLEHAHRQRGGATKVPLGALDGCLKVRTQGVPNPFEHAVEGGKGTQGFVGDGFHHVLKDAEHRALADGTGAAGEKVVLGQGDQRFLKQLKLIGLERIVFIEVVDIPKWHISAGAVAELEDGFKVGALVIVELCQFLQRFRLLGKEAPADHHRHVVAGQVEWGQEASLDLGEVVGFRSHLADDGGQITLGGDKEPGSPFALGRKRLDDGLEVEHQLRIPADKLPDFIHKKVQPEILRLFGKPCVHGFGKRLDGDLVGRLFTVQGLERLVIRHTADFRIGPSKGFVFQRVDDVAIILPVPALRLTKIGLFEG